MNKPTLSFDGDSNTGTHPATSGMWCETHKIRAFSSNRCAKWKGRISPCHIVMEKSDPGEEES